MLQKAMLSLVFILCLGLFVQLVSDTPFKEKEHEAFTYAYLECTGSYQAMPARIQEFMGAFFQQGHTPTGAMITVYYNSPEKVSEKDLRWRVGFPVSDDAPVKEPLKKATYKKKTVLQYLHKGSYEALPEVYRKIQAYMKEKGLEFSLPTYEFYLNSPMNVKPEELLTRIEIPLKTD